MPARGGRGAARRPACARFWPRSSSTSPGVAEPMTRAAPTSRSEYPHLLAIPTRWMDNDVFGHVNNVVYYSYFDTVINRYLIDEGGLDPHRGAVVGMAVET